MGLSLSAAIQRTVEHREIFADEMLELMRQIMSGEVSELHMAALIVGLRVKKETIGEISAAAQVMREMALKVPVDEPQQVVDCCGTGGDSKNSFNISTAASFIAAAAGARIAKHCGRSVSSSSGSADVLEALGVALSADVGRLQQLFSQHNLMFLFAPNHHSAMRHVAPVRKALGVRTIFNLLGPLTNPAGATRQLLGVFHQDLVGIMVRVLHRLEAEHALVVHAVDGLDEISLGSTTLVGELKNGQVHEYAVEPDQFGMGRVLSHELVCSDVQASMLMFKEALQQPHSPAAKVASVNAGALLYVAGKAESLLAGAKLAQQLVASGAAWAKLEAFQRDSARAH